MRQHLIDPEICIRCNTCEKRCPTGAISHARNYVVDSAVCTFCMACVRPCPTGAIDTWFNVERPFGLAEQHGWTMLPALAAEAAGAIPDAFDSEATRILEIAHADLRGPARPPASASKPRINAFTREAPARAVVTGNTRITADASASDVHHIILDFGAEPFPYLEGQSVGLVPPSLDSAGRPHEMRLYSAASARDGERPNTNNLALTVKRVVTEAGPGVASNWLCDRALGEELEVVGPFGATFLMPDDPQADLLMICTGTGVSPFRGFTHRRRRVAPKGPGGLYLFFAALCIKRTKPPGQSYETERAGVGVRAVRAWGLLMATLCFCLGGVVVEARGLPSVAEGLVSGARDAVYHASAEPRMPYFFSEEIIISNKGYNKNSIISTVKNRVIIIFGKNARVSNCLSFLSAGTNHSKINFFVGVHKAVHIIRLLRNVQALERIGTTKYSSLKNNILGGRLPGVFYNKFHGWPGNWPIYIDRLLWNDRKISSDLRLTNFPGDAYRFLRGQSGRFGLFDGLPSSPSRTLGVGSSVLSGFQGSPEQFQSYSGHSNRGDGSEEHQLSPKRHSLLGFQIAYFMLVGGLACGAALLGYQIADRGFDALDRGQKVRGGVQFWAGIFVCCGLSFAVIWGGLHLSFIWWFPWLL